MGVAIVFIRMTIVITPDYAVCGCCVYKSVVWLKVLKEEGVCSVVAVISGWVRALMVCDIVRDQKYI